MPSHQVISQLQLLNEQLSNELGEDMDLLLGSSNLWALEQKIHYGYSFWKRFANILENKFREGEGRAVALEFIAHTLPFHAYKLILPHLSSDFHRAIREKYSLLQHLFNESLSPAGTLILNDLTPGGFLIAVSTLKENEINMLEDSAIAYYVKHTDALAIMRCLILEPEKFPQTQAIRTLFRLRSIGLGICGEHYINTWSILASIVAHQTPDGLFKQTASCKVLRTEFETSLQETAAFDKETIATVIPAGYILKKYLGRTVLFENPDDPNADYWAVKVAKDEESDKSQLEREYKTVQFYKAHQADLRLKSVLPHPRGLYVFKGLISYLDDLEISEGKADFLSLIDSQLPQHDAYVYSANKNYFIYLQDIADDAVAKHASHDALHDLCQLLKLNILYPSLVPIFHRDGPSYEDDGGVYLPLKNILWHYISYRNLGSMGLGPGALITPVSKSFAYPNIRQTGLADLGDFLFIENIQKNNPTLYASMKSMRLDRRHYTWESRTTQIMALNTLATYFFVFIILNATRLKKFKVPDNLASTLMEIVCTGIQYMTSVQQETISSFLECAVDAEKLQKQLAFYFEHQHADPDKYSALLKQAIPDLYGDAVVNKNILIRRTDSIGSRGGSCFPITEASKLVELTMLMLCALRTENSMASYDIPFPTFPSNQCIYHSNFASWFYFLLRNLVPEKLGDLQKIINPADHGLLDSLLLSPNQSLDVSKIQSLASLFRERSAPEESIEILVEWLRSREFKEKKAFILKYKSGEELENFATSEHMNVILSECPQEEKLSTIREFRLHTAILNISQDKRAIKKFIPIFIRLLGQLLECDRDQFLLDTLGSISVQTIIQISDRYLDDVFLRALSVYHRLAFLKAHELIPLIATEYPPFVRCRIAQALSSEDQEEYFTLMEAEAKAPQKTLKSPHEDTLGDDVIPPGVTKYGLFPQQIDKKSTESAYHDRKPLAFQ